MMIDYDIFDRFITGFLAVILALMSLVVAGNVFCRFVLNSSLYWADEFAQILLVWLTFIGAALAVKDKSHYVLNFLTENFTANKRKYFGLSNRFLFWFQ